MGWEYREEDVPKEGRIERLSALGDEGWRLHHVVNHSAVFVDGDGVPQECWQCVFERMKMVGPPSLLPEAPRILATPPPRKPKRR